MPTYPGLRTAVACAVTSALPAITAAQFAHTYLHSVSDDHISLIRANTEQHYVQASTRQGATKDIHLMMFDNAGNTVQDVTFFSPSGDEIALDVCRGNNNTYLVCGYETVGGLDLGFVLQVDANFNFLNKVRIQVPANDRHTPALRIINSAFYSSPPSITTYFPPDATGGYLVAGFEAAGYNPSDPKSGYAIKLSNALTVQWSFRFDSPIAPGAPDWDMCSHATYLWTSPAGYFVGGSGTDPNGNQAAMAALINSGTGAVIWSKLYHDTSQSGESAVAVDAAWDDSSDELYQITNHSSHRGGGFVTFDRQTGTIIPNLTTRFLTSSPDHYVYEFGATCASDVLLISGFGHNQAWNAINGYFPFTFRYYKGSVTPPNVGPPFVDTNNARYEYPVQSAGYNPISTIFDAYQTGHHPRIYHPKLFAQLMANEITLAAIEDASTIQENHLLQPLMNGTHSCPYMDPGFAAVPMPLIEWPVNDQPGNYVTLPGSYAQAPLSAPVQSCYSCPVNTNFTVTQGSGCTYTFAASAPGSCPTFTITDVASNVLLSSASALVNFTFPTSGTYTICYEDCAIGSNGVVCRDSTCQVIQVDCPPPCPMDADFGFTANGCCVNFNDLTPEGNPHGCEYWVFGTSATVQAGDATSYCFPGPGTYTVCHVDCCIAPNGTATYHQVCKQVTVSCAPPCCLPTGINVTVNGCCINASPVWPSGPCSTPLAYYWSFGNSQISYQQNASYCYPKPGIYTVCLTVVCTKKQYVQICKTVNVGCISPPPPSAASGTARFSYSASGTQVALRPAPDPPGTLITSHLWSFGDGTTSTEPSPTHYYAMSGTYTVTHVVEGIVLATGEPFIDEAMLPVTLVLAPACGCTPPTTGAFAMNSLVCEQRNSVLLKLFDPDAQSAINHQWMVSTCGGPGCPLQSFVPVPGAVGQHVWIEGLDSTAWFRCRSSSPLGFITWSDEVEVTHAPLQVQAAAAENPICPGDPVQLTATGASTYVWSTGQTGSAITVSPDSTSTFEVSGSNTAGCLDTASVTVAVDEAVCGVRPALRALLEGPLDPGTGLMHDSLRVLGLLPAHEPYTAAGYAWPPGSSGGDLAAPSAFAATGPDAIADWVVVELRDAIDPSQVLAARCGLIQRDGDIVAADGSTPLRFNLPQGPYHVAVRHRNHLGVMTAAPIAFGTTPTAVDLSTEATPAWGTEARKAIGALRALWMGNVVNDGVLRYVGAGNDRDPILVAIGGSVPTAVITGYRAEDTNMDGKVKYTGAGNDRDPILVNVGGSVPTNTRTEQLP